MRILKIICIIACLGTLSSCAVFKDKKKENEIETVEQMYNSATNKLQKGSYEDAIEKFEELERTYPYSKWAIKAKIMSAYSSYQQEDYDSALVTLENFTKLHPGNKDIAYAYYLRALCFYEQISDVTKDQSYSLYSKSALQEVIARFPSSKYANDARLKLDLVNDHLAGKEVEVGRFYQKQGKPIAAINRFKKVVDHYDTTAHVSEALHRLVESYMSLGVKGQAIKYASVLGHNFPGSKWYERSYYLIEGRKPDDKPVVADDKWYNFKKWTGIKFINDKLSRKSKDDNSKELVNSISKEIEEDSIEGKSVNAEPKNVPLPKKRQVGVMEKVGNFFKGLAMSVSDGKKDDAEK